MTSEFPILLVTQKAYEASSNETLGSKYKFWFDHEELGRCLYKQSRENLGEDWAEKVASELCELLGLPHAVYELASTWEGSRGVVSPNFLSQGGTLVHGNELLSSIVPNYPAFGTYGISQHTTYNRCSAEGDRKRICKFTHWLDTALWHPNSSRCVCWLSSARCVDW
ncbi:MAG: hypothetical protein V7K72_14280 [Nostoc sp.]|uniref:hypothetical protein n=1 Tax=Nostoc sp. TaxID=1180 RepID=UPI002FFA386F